eukprot:g5166.t1
MATKLKLPPRVALSFKNKAAWQLSPSVAARLDKMLEIYESSPTANEPTEEDPYDQTELIDQLISLQGMVDPSNNMPEMTPEKVAAKICQGKENPLEQAQLIVRKYYLDKNALNKEKTYVIPMSIPDAESCELVYKAKRLEYVEQFPRCCDECNLEIAEGQKLFWCSKCKEARYCSKTCQKAAWKSNKFETFTFWSGHKKQCGDTKRHVFHRSQMRSLSSSNGVDAEPPITALIQSARESILLTNAEKHYNETKVQQQTLMEIAFNRSITLGDKFSYTIGNSTRGRTPTEIILYAPHSKRLQYKSLHKIGMMFQRNLINQGEPLKEPCFVSGCILYFSMKLIPCSEEVKNLAEKNNLIQHREWQSLGLVKKDYQLVFAILPDMKGKFPVAGNSSSCDYENWYNDVPSWLLTGSVDK